MRFLRLILTEGFDRLRPRPDESQPSGYSYRSAEEALGLPAGAGQVGLDQLASLGYLRREVFGFALLCPRCEQRSTEHVHLAPGERRACAHCGRTFAFEEGRLLRIHSYAPTLLAQRAVEQGNGVESPVRKSPAPLRAGRPARRALPPPGRRLRRNRFLDPRRRRL